MNAGGFRFVLVFVLLIGSGCHYFGLRQEGTEAVIPSTALQKERGVESKDLTSEESAAACIATAEELENNGWDREAITIYERALTFEPSRKGISRRLARLHARVGDTDSARTLFEKAVVESPDDASVHNDFGYFLYEVGDLESAESQLRRTLKMRPDDRRCQTNLALTLAAAGRFDESLELFEQAVGPAAARSNVAVVLAQAGKLSESRVMLAKARALDPTIAQAKVTQGWLDGAKVPSEADPAVGKAKVE
jgi:Tfp pilus assembly protein PilF